MKKLSKTTKWVVMAIFVATILLVIFNPLPSLLRWAGVGVTYGWALGMATLTNDPSVCMLIDENSPPGFFAGGYYPGESYYELQDRCVQSYAIVENDPTACKYLQTSDIDRMNCESEVRCRQLGDLVAKKQNIAEYQGCNIETIRTGEPSAKLIDFSYSVSSFECVVTGRGCPHVCAVVNGDNTVIGEENISKEYGETIADKCRGYRK